MYRTYILYSAAFDRYYVGHCENLDQRVRRHNLKMVPSTKAYTPWELVYHETFNSRKEAAARERAIKSKKSRIYIEKLIGSRTD